MKFFPQYINFTLLICVCECMRMRLPLFPPSVIKFVVSCKLARIGLLLLLDGWTRGPQRQKCAQFTFMPEFSKITRIMQEIIGSQKTWGVGPQFMWKQLTCDRPRALLGKSISFPKCCLKLHLKLVN